MKLLLVDDEPEILNFLQKTIEDKFKCQIERAESGLDAFIKCQDNIFDFIITDYKMPFMTGAALVMALKTRNNVNSDTHCLILTAYLTKDLKEQLNVDRVQFLSKPIQLDQLFEIIGPFFELR
ncbi:hypothetical protein A9Q84_07400 [Halobacteriovorax marinus]|mgnify:CR=1 FL=1|uniref:Response regulatory domain-containing protein n=1 Tax=Halobacteriovorax marinus TaxID=97084 RepID=A0A1Y5F5M1_9BACT|nr:hypothetical protein A9Q84_07400 [Halobacteriovorax marinus]